MTNKILFLIAILLLTSTVKSQYTIYGKIDNSAVPNLKKGIMNGDTLVLKFINIPRADTAIVNNNKFLLTGKVPYPSIAFVKSSFAMGLILLDNSEYQCVFKLIKKDSIQRYYIPEITSKESSFHNTWRRFIDRKNAINSEISHHTERLSKVSDRDSIAYYRKKIKEGEDRIADSYWQLATESSNKYAVAYIIPAAPDFSYKKYQDIYDALPDSVKGTFYGKNFREFLETSRAGESLKIGSVKAEDVMPSMAVVDTSMQKMKLDNRFYRQQRYTIIDFWASWCAPCRKATEVYKRLYPKLQEQRIAMVSYSLDKSIPDWKRAVKVDAPDWLQVSDLAVTGSPLAKFLKINMIPANVVVDSDGKIVGRNITPDSMEGFLQSLK